MKHKCKYCNKASNKTRDELVEIGWSFADIRAPVRKYITACPEHQCEITNDLNEVFQHE